VVIVRRSSPTKLDEAPYKSRCIVRDNHRKDYEIYIQTSKESDTPKWDLIGVFDEYTGQTYIDQLISMRLEL